MHCRQNPRNIVQLEMGDDKGDDELYYSSDDEYDSNRDKKFNSDQYININLYHNAYSYLRLLLFSSETSLISVKNNNKSYPWS